VLSALIYNAHYSGFDSLALTGVKFRPLTANQLQQNIPIYGLGVCGGSVYCD